MEIEISKTLTLALAISALSPKKSSRWRSGEKREERFVKHRWKKERDLTDRISWGDNGPVRSHQESTDPMGSSYKREAD